MAHDGQAVAFEPLETDSPLPSGQDPMEIRWGINPTIKNRVVERGYGNGSFVPYGKWFPIQHHEYPDEFHSVDEQAPRMITKTRTAQEIEDHYKTSLGGSGLEGSLNWGFQIGFHGEKDAGKMAVISKALLPSLPDIRRICNDYQLTCPIPTICDGQDDLDFGERETCPTCWLQWIQSDACTSYLDIISRDGMLVQTVGDDASERRITPVLSDLLTARTITTRSLQTGLVSLQAQWKQVLQEYDKGERQGLDAGGVLQGIRKDVHAPAPQNRQMEMVKQFAQAAGGGSNNDALLAALAQSQIQTNALLGTLVQQNAGVAPTVSSTPVQTNQVEVTYGMGDVVICEGEQGIIQDVKNAGWFEVKTATGTKTVRKDKLTKEN